MLYFEIISCCVSCVYVVKVVWYSRVCALYYGVFVDEVVEEGVDCEAGDALDACFAHDVLAVGGDGEDAHVEA